jgi:hypothetical protein
VIAYCEMGEGRPRRAVAAMRQALRRDPGNWSLYYGLAVARGAAGLDPRRAARTAARLNPQEPRARAAPSHFRGDSPSAWRAAAGSAIVVPPDQGDP